MPVLFDELHQLLENPDYSRFILTNLHLHTPATASDWNGWSNQTHAAADVTPEIYFQHLNATSLELAAITDHNTVSWCAPLIQIAKQARKQELSHIHILPGVEITTYEGPHLVALFDEDQDVGDIHKMLTRLGISGQGGTDDAAGRATVGREVVINEIIDEVSGLNGIIIAPHVHRKDGLWGHKEFKGRYNILNDPRLRLLAAPPGDIKRVEDPTGRTRLLYKNMDSSKVTNSFGFLNVADCHRLEDFGLDATWIKMTTPSLSGVRQVEYEPELRVSCALACSSSDVEFPETIHYSEPSLPSHPHILAVAVTGGMLDGLKVQFSPHQNTIIGLNYAGKSALLDCIRFALAMEPLDGDPHASFASRIRAFVGEAGEVRLYWRDMNQTTHAVSRACIVAQSRSRSTEPKWHLEGSPDVYTLLRGEFRKDSSASIADLFRPEFFAQGEVASIKDHVDQQMRIIDSLARVDYDLRQFLDSHLDGEPTLRSKLAQNAQDNLAASQRCAELMEETARIKPLEEEIAELENLQVSPLYTSKKEWAATGVKIHEHLTRLRDLRKQWNLESLQHVTEDSTDTQTSPTPDAEEVSVFNENEASPIDYLKHASGIFGTAIQTVNGEAESAVNTLDTAIDSLTALDTARSAREEAVLADMQASLRPEQSDTIGDKLIDTITEKQKLLTQLRLKSNELEKAEEESKALLKARATLLKEADKLRQDIRKSRLAVVQQIDSKSMANISAKLIEDADSTQYRTQLGKIADRLTSAANKIQNKDKQLDAVSESFTPRELVEVVNAGNPNEICKKDVSITPNTANILMTMGQADIFELEECSLEDSFIVRYKREGDEDFTPIDSGLSGGEQALALISVAMIPKDIPLVIDQPEDELGPALITRNLVEQIRAVKASRQLIFVTHVPNIPVLADSEQIIYVQQHVSPPTKHCEISCCGSLDRPRIVQHLLELDGGPQAFEKRTQRYSPFIKIDATVQL